jgi:8-amino-7-oxononanoate synthase
VRIDDRELIDFSSNDYLGLASHPELIRRSRMWLECWGCGSRASRLLSGNIDLYASVEHRLARGKGTEAALVLASGFQANSTVLSALLDRHVHSGIEPLVFTDRLNHASIHHGCQAAGIRQLRYRHNDPDHLEHLLQSTTSRPGPRFILSETVFSMDGDLADLASLTRLKERYGAFLYLDEAHATGLFGTHGFGLVEDHLARHGTGAVDLTMGTFSKALGGFGAYVACAAELRDYLVNACPGLVYSTALPPAILGAMDAALELLPQLEQERATVQRHGETVRQRLRALELDTGASASPVVPVLLGSEARTLTWARALEQAGLLVAAIRPPTVPNGSSRLRISLSAAHTAEDIDRLLALLAELAQTGPANGSGTVP